MSHRPRGQSINFPLPESRTFRVLAYSAPVGISIVSTLFQVPVSPAGTLVQVSTMTTAVNIGSTDSSSSFIVGSFVTTGAALQIIPVNAGTKTATVGATGFAADVTFAVISGLVAGGLAPVVLAASNGGAGPLSANIAVRTWNNVESFA